jgi:hypothetical protein
LFKAEKLDGTMLIDLKQRRSGRVCLLGDGVPRSTEKRCGAGLPSQILGSPQYNRSACEPLSRFKSMPLATSNAFRKQEQGQPVLMRPAQVSSFM